MNQAEEFCPFQLIDEKGVLDDARIETFAKDVKLAECGLSYFTVSIMGPQSSGKSTLLNHLFGTKFREMNALEDRCQTTKGIWLAKCAGIEPCTLVMDLEGTDGRERGMDDTAFEKQAALFALAISDIILINMWCHDIGREQAANKPLLRTVFEVMGKLFSFRKTTLLFVVRDKTKSPMKVLENNLWKDISQIWDSFDKPDGHKETPLDEIFNVKIVALSSYEEKEEQFTEQVANLRQQFFNSVALRGFAGDGREVVPASGFSFSAQEIWKVIRENKDLNLPAHKVMVATVRCEEIANEKLNLLVANEDRCQLEKDEHSYPVPDFGKKLSLILETYLSEYDVEAKYFDEGVRTERRKQLKDKMLQLVEPAYQRMLEHIHSQTLDRFKEAFQEKINGSEEFFVSAHDSIKSSMTQFDELCADVMVKQANWNSSKQRDKLQHDMDSHVAAICSSKVSEIRTLHEAKLEAVLTGHVEMLLVRAGDGTWQEIREYSERQMQSAISEISSAVSGFRMDEHTYNEMVLQLKDYARGVIQAKARQEAARVLTRMNDRFERFFSHDSDSKLRVWSGKEDVQGIKENAFSASLKLLSIMAAIRLDDKADDIEKSLFLAFVAKDESTKKCDPLASDIWEEVPSSETLITPIQCKDIWKQFTENSEPIVKRAQEACRGVDMNWSSFASGVAAGAAMGVAGATAIIGATGSTTIGAGYSSAAEAFTRFAGQVITEASPLLLSHLKHLSK
ncbi:hypothetical protein LguiA_010768 [Lonicera macranthoides]